MLAVFSFFLLDERFVTSSTSSSSDLAQTKIFLSAFYVCPKVLQIKMR